jgi:hypothetical protein
MDYSNLELNHEANTLAQFEANLIEKGYIIIGKIQDIKLDDFGRPYVQTLTGKDMLPNRNLVSKNKNR